ncbi:MAG: hypothetical protein EPN97_11845 [Alphaproteobacteria bacterium]|nr:MAG: hypothetical protein EPN97_11845 [Alphaproteobacteria bacterium]
MSGKDLYGRSAPEPATAAAPALTQGDIQNAVEYLAKVLIDSYGKSIDNPVTIQFGNGVKIYKGDDFAGSGLTGVGRVIAENMGIQPDTTSEPLKAIVSGIQNAVETLGKAIPQSLDRIDNPVTIQFGNGVKIFKGDDFAGGGTPNVGRAIAEIAGIKPDISQPDVPLSTLGVDCGDGHKTYLQIRNMDHFQAVDAQNKTGEDLVSAVLNANKGNVASITRWVGDKRNDGPNGEYAEQFFDKSGNMAMATRYTADKQNDGPHGDPAFKSFDEYGTVKNATSYKDGVSMGDVIKDYQAVEVKQGQSQFFHPTVTAPKA